MVSSQFETPRALRSARLIFKKWAQTGNVDSSEVLDFFIRLRQSIERLNSKNQYPTLWRYSNWMAHDTLNRKPHTEVLRDLSRVLSNHIKNERTDGVADLSALCGSAFSILLDREALFTEIDRILGEYFPDERIEISQNTIWKFFCETWARIEGNPIELEKGKRYNFASSSTALAVEADTLVVGVRLNIKGFVQQAGYVVELQADIQTREITHGVSIVMPITFRKAYGRDPTLPNAICYLAPARA